jgi:hypothetical protein
MLQVCAHLLLLLLLLPELPTKLLQPVLAVSIHAAAAAAAAVAFE